MGTIHAEERTMLIPAPPFSRGLERYAGIQVNRPQYANRTAVLMAEARTVRRSSGGRKITPKGMRTRFGCQMAGSGTLRRIHNVKTAGRSPMTNSARQPQ